VAPSGAWNRERNNIRSHNTSGIPSLLPCHIAIYTILLLAVKNVKARRHSFPLPVQASVQYSEYTIRAMYSIITVLLPIKGGKLECF